MIMRALLDPMNGIGSRLKEWREARGWSQSRLGSEVGVTQGTVSKWESEDVSPEAGPRVRLLELSGGLFGLRDWDAPPAAPASAPPPAPEAA
jgi:transcriptional regulator with XRE-family HTH domain